MSSEQRREAGADTDYVADSELSPGVPVRNKQSVNTRKKTERGVAVPMKQSVNTRSKTERGSSQGGCTCTCGCVPEELVSCFMYNA